MSPISSSGISALNHASAVLTRAASGIASQSVDPKADIAKDLVNLEQAKAGASTAVALVRTGDEMQKSLLDIFA